MEGKIFISPKFAGHRFDEHVLPVNILESFTALEELLIEVAKSIFLKENVNRTRVPKGFSEGINLNLVKIGEGSAVANFSISTSSPMPPSLPFENVSNFVYFEKARNKIISLIESANNGQVSHGIDFKTLAYFNRIGKHLLDDESIDFGYDYGTKVESKAILNKTTRKKILLSSEQKTEYMDSIKLFGLIPKIDQKNSWFEIETDSGLIKCRLAPNIKETIFTAFYEYNDRTYVMLKGTGLFNRTDKIQEVIEVESVDVLDPRDVSLRISNLTKLEDGWYEGRGRALSRENLERFDNLFNTYFDNKSPLPAIFPTPDGNIQLEWKKENKNIVLDVDISSLSSEFFYYNDLDEKDEKEEQIVLADSNGWDTLNTLIQTCI